jgi:hypothetical protein
MNKEYNPGFWNDEDEEEELQEAYSDSMNFRHFVSVCPNCKQPLTEEMDSCPFCGDIIFRHLTHGTFAPRKGPLVKIIAFIIALLVILATLGLLLQVIF